MPPAPSRAMAPHARGLALFLLLATSVAQGQATSAPDDPVLEPPADEVIEVNVEGVSPEERMRQSAEAVRVIDLRDIQREAVDLGQALSRTEGVGVRRAGGLGSRARFSLAGLSDDQVRFFVDGVPLELAGLGPDFANVPVNLVQRLEVYQGVVPIRFGADALGGAVNIVTTEEIQGTHASASYELGSFATHRLTLSGRHLGESSGFFVRATGYFDRSPNDYRIRVQVPDEQGRLVLTQVSRFHDGFRAGGGAIEAGVIDRPWAHRLLLRVFLGDASKEIQHDATMQNPFGDVDSGNRSAGATLRFDRALGDSIVAEVVGGYVHRQARFVDLGRCAYDWFGQCVVELPQAGEMLAGGVDRSVRQHTGFARAHLEWTPAPEHAVRLSLAPTVVSRSGEDRALRERGQLDPLTGAREMTTLVVGLEYERDALDGRLENIAFAKDYLQHMAADRLLPSNVFAPARQRHHSIGVGDSLRYRLSSTLLAKVSYERATRLPTPDAVFGDGVLIGDNLDLKPETSHNLNLELSADLPDTPYGAFRGSVMGFGRLADQLIVLLGDQGYFTHRNVLAARCVGAAGALGWTSVGQHVALDTNITWQDLRATSSEGAFGTFDGQRIPNRPSLLAHAGVRLQWPGLLRDTDELSLSWHSRYIHAFFRAWERLGIESSKQRVDAQLLHSMALTYVLRATAGTVSWTFDVQNLTDATAVDFYGVQRPGRALSLKVVAEF
ncbi:ligand-gated channel protein [Corallococcus sp. H22C18031201]|nr:ligand-gated channel protein [Corallococcus sp. H22C18031201]